MATMAIEHRATGLESSQTIATFIWGFSLACGMFSMAKAIEQTYKAWRRSGSINSYIIMVWMEWISSVVISILSWLFIKGYIPPSIGFFVGILCLWVIQVQCIMQIIINRVTLILYNPDQASRLKWGVALVIAVVNVSVFCIWVPARLNVSSTFVELNTVWDRIEKCIILFIDAGLNIYFMWLVKSKLVDTGLNKYMLLFKVNLFLVCVSVSLDILILGMMSLSNSVVYIQFHPLAYLIKLYIEMNVAELIGKIVKSAQRRSTSFSTSYSNQRSSPGNSRTPTSAFRRDVWDFPSSTYVASGGQMHELNTDVFRDGTPGCGPNDMTGVVVKEASPRSPRSCYHRATKSETTGGLYGRQLGMHKRESV